MFVDEKYWAARQNGNVSLEEEAEKYLRVNNLAYQDRPEDLALTTHICRGNYHSTYACTGPYDSIAPILLQKRMLMPSILSLTMKDPAVLNH